MTVAISRHEEAIAWIYCHLTNFPKR